MPSYRYSFISHAHADNTLCDPFEAAFARLGIPHYYDRANPQVGHDIGESLERELKRAQALVVLASPQSLTSPWVREEINIFFALMMREPARMLVPVKIASCDLPPRLEARWWVDAVGRPVDEVAAEVARALEDTTQEAFDPTKAATPSLATLMSQITALQMELDTTSRNAEKKEQQVHNMLRAVLMHLIGLYDEYDDLYDTIAISSSGELSPMIQNLKAFKAGLIETLKRNGVEPYKIDGDIYDPQQQRPLQVLTTNDPDLDKRIARRVRIGFRTAERILRQELVDVYRYQP